MRNCVEPLEAYRKALLADERRVINRRIQELEQELKSR
jgi:hypothetical protein